MNFDQLIALPRTCTWVPDSDHAPEQRPIEDFRNHRCYVLLGDPGAGKSSVFAQEAAAASALGAGIKISARDFIYLPILPQWQDKVLFIDGLDEMRAGGIDGRQPLDAIRGKLAQLGCPPFRLSCREADWLGASDQAALAMLYSPEPVPMLHLDKLDGNDAAALLTALGEPFPEDFMAEARAKGMGDFLRTPLGVKLLIEAVGGGHDWPANRTEAFALAVKKLLIERNTEHENAQRNQVHTTQSVRQAAAELCAIHLLAQFEGYALTPSSADPAHPAIQTLGFEPIQAHLLALKTKLFIADGAEALRKPFHRTLAEYLAAEDLSERIASGKHTVPRLLALLGPGDGSITPSLRGLAAWLALFSLPCRQQLIAQDPVGLFSYGDAGQFNDADLEQMLKCLEAFFRRHPSQHFYQWDKQAVTVLTRPSLAPILRRYLERLSGDEALGAVQYLILKALASGLPPADLAPTLEAFAKNPQASPFLRDLALAAYLKLASPAESLAFLSAVHSGEIKDEENQLLAQLLQHLFPAHLTGRDLRPYLHLPTPTGARHSSSYGWFWHHTFFQSATPEDLTALLNTLVEAPLAIGYHPDHFDLRRFLSQLLSKGVTQVDHHGHIPRLLTWLQLGIQEYSSILEPECQQKIVAWLGKHPEIYKALYRHILNIHRGTEQFGAKVNEAKAALYGALPPEDFAPWCLHLAAEASDGVLAQYLLTQAFFDEAHHRGHWGPKTLDLISDWVEKHPQFQSQWDYLRTCEISEWKRESAQKRQQWQTQQAQRKADWLDHVHQHLNALNANTAPHGLLHDLVMLGEGRLLGGEGKTPEARLQSIFGEYPDLLAAIDRALTRVLDRSDIPSVKEIIETEVDGRFFYIRPAYLQAMARQDAHSPESVLQFSDEQLGKALAFRLTYDDGAPPRWLKELLRCRPKLFAEVYLAYAKACMKAKRDIHIALLSHLAHDPDFAALAATVGPALLSTLPVKANKEKVRHLEYLLCAGLKHFPDALRPLCANRLARKSLDAAQRVLWLTCATLLNPADDPSALVTCVSQDETRANVLAGFLGNSELGPHLYQSLPARTLALFIRILGPIYPPLHPLGADWVSPAERTGHYVQALIDQLGQCPETEAGDSLRQLMEMKSLTPWQRILTLAADTQKITRREAQFSPPRVDQIVASLRQGRPASPGELKALVVELLTQIGEELRHGDTNGYRRCWLGDKPQDENECRDYLLELIRPHLHPLGIEAQKEGYFAEDKRADIRVSYQSGQWIVPVEIKRELHSDVWRAMATQLMGQYTPDPRAFGQGIYLVLWFGLRHGPRGPLPPNGIRPKSAKEMAQNLRSLLIPQEQALISVVVLDVSRRSGNNAQGA